MGSSAKRRFVRIQLSQTARPEAESNERDSRDLMFLALGPRSLVQRRISRRPVRLTFGWTLNE